MSRLMFFVIGHLLFEAFDHYASHQLFVDLIRHLPLDGLAHVSFNAIRCIFCIVIAHFFINPIPHLFFIKNKIELH